MERTLISFNLPNIITVNLMALAGFLVLAFGYQLWMQYSGGGSPQMNAGY